MCVDWSVGGEWSRSYYRSTDGGSQITYFLLSFIMRCSTCCRTLSEVNKRLVSFSKHEPLVLPNTLLQSGSDLAFDSVVELRPSAQQQVDPGAESRVSGEIQGGQSTLGLRPHPSQQLLEKSTPFCRQLCSRSTSCHCGSMVAVKDQTPPHHSKHHKCLKRRSVF